eukprot:scaffold2.g7369.t1
MVSAAEARKVLETPKDCGASASADPRIRAYVKQLEKVGVWQLLGEEWPIDSTVFVPAAALPGSAAQANPYAIALYHLVTSGAFTIKELTENEDIATALPSQLLTFSRDAQGAAYVGNGIHRAKVLRSERICDTWVHVIQHALLPQEADAASAEAGATPHIILPTSRALAEGPAPAKPAQPRLLLEGIESLFGADSPEPAPAAPRLLLEQLDELSLPVVEPATADAAAPAPAAA